MKTCNVCEEEKDDDQFWRRKDALQPNCIACQSSINKARYKKNPKNQQKCVQKNIRRRRDIFNEWKSTLKCCNCPEDFFKCLDFHHLDPSEKDYTIGGMARNTGMAKVQAEVNKCVVVCANCHRKIHEDELVLSQDIINESRKMTETLKEFWLSKSKGRVAAFE